MEKAKVYFTSMRVKAFGDNLLAKLQRLMRKAGIERIDFKDRFAAIKIHFGEAGNLSFVRPNFARVVAEEVKKLGGHPFLTDCNTLYVGSRKHALEHIETAYRNGFTPYTTGCHIIIGDGLKGTDDVAVPVPNGEYVKEAKIGRAVKNIGMGCGSRAGKMEQHCDGKPTVKQELCVGCHNCAKICAHGAPTFTGGKASIDHNRCVGCGRCIGVCPKDAIEPSWGQEQGLLDKKMAEYALAVVHGRPQFHISLVMDVSPYCDCHPENDAPIVPNIGMFASFDPVALDQACADAVNRQKPLADSVLAEHGDHHHDHFKDVSPETNWELQLDHAVKIGLGTREYELVTV